MTYLPTGKRETNVTQKANKGHKTQIAHEFPRHRKLRKLLDLCGLYLGYNIGKQLWGWGCSDGASGKSGSEFS